MICNIEQFGLSNTVCFIVATWEKIVMYIFFDIKHLLFIG